MLRLLMISFLFCGSVWAKPGIATGSTTGTYIKIGTDISKTCADQVPLDVFESKGSLENYKRIVKDPNVKFIIAQYDVLQYMDAIGHKDAKKIKMVYPLYNEEIHIIVPAQKNVTKLSDLNGKKVVIGTEGSGTWVTSSLLIEKGDLKWETVLEGTKEGLTKLVKGNVDAVIAIAGVPTTLLSKMPENASEVIKIASLEDPLLDNLYQKSVIKANSYPFQKEDINTYAIKSILATYDYKIGQPSFERVQKIYQCIQINMGKLQTSGHPKWKEVDFAKHTDVKWPLHSAVLHELGQKPANESGDAKSSILKSLQSM